MSIQGGARPLFAPAIGAPYWRRRRLRIPILAATAVLALLVLLLPTIALADSVDVPYWGNVDVRFAPGQLLRFDSSTPGTVYRDPVPVIAPEDQPAHQQIIPTLEWNFRTNILYSNIREYDVRFTADEIGGRDNWNHIHMYWYDSQNWRWKDVTTMWSIFPSPDGNGFDGEIDGVPGSIGNIGDPATVVITRPADGWVDTGSGVRAQSPGGKVQAVFGDVTSGGDLTVTESSPSSIPDGMALPDASFAFNISSSAVFDSAAVTVSYDASKLGSMDESSLKLYHFDGGSWVDVTTSQDLANHTITGSVSSFSPFIIVGPPGPTPVSQATSSPASSVWSLALLAVAAAGWAVFSARRRHRLS